MISFYVWLALAVVLFILEVLISLSFALLCFSLAAVVTALVALLGLGMSVELIVFAVCSLLAFLFIRPYLINHLNRRSKHLPKTNAEALIGRKGTVVEPIRGNLTPGRVAIDGDVWQAVTKDGTEIEKDAVVEVTAIDSIILTVKRA